MVAGLAALVLLMLGLSIPMAVQAQIPLTGRQAALDAEARCADQSEVLNVVDVARQAISGRWVTIAGPTFGRKPGEPRDPIVAHAVDPRDPMRQYASDGRSIQRTVDGGCTWSEVRRVPPSNPNISINETGLADAVLQIGVTETGDSPGHVWVLAGPLEDSISPIRVFVSPDGGETWQTRSTGLPAVHTRTDTGSVSTDVGVNRPSAVLALAPSDPDTAYIGLSSAAEGDGPVYATEDGGRSWIRRTIVGASVGVPGRITEMVVDPGDPASVWMLGGAGGELLQSSDRGANWIAPSLGPAGGDVRADGLHVSRSGGSLHVQVLGSSGFEEHATLYRSRDGRTFIPSNLVEPIRGDAMASQGGRPGELVLSTDRPDQVLALDLASPTGTAFRNISSLGLGHARAPQSDRTAEPVHWFRRYDGLAAFVPGPVRGVVPPPVKALPGRLFDAVTGTRGRGERVPGTLTPDPLELQLDPEGAAAVDYLLELPPLPTPVDIWFLMDTSGSMGGAIEGLQLGIDRIIEELKGAGLDAWFGLAEYKGENYRYQRLADIAPPGKSFEAGLRRLYASGGGEETQYTSLYQTATGVGQEDVGIQAGRGASFRPEALKIVVHASDEPFGNVPDGPTAQDAIVALNAKGIFHVGLDLSAGAEGISTAPPTNNVKEDMDEIARATGTFAPPEGVDCNGDGAIDLQAGEPLTCPIIRGQDNVEISEAIISAVRAVRDETAVGLAVEDAGGIGVSVKDPLRVPVNVKVANRLPFQVEFSCPREMTGEVATVKLLAAVRGVASAPATAKIACGTPPVVAPAAVPGPLPPLVPFIATPPQLVPELEPAISPLNQPSPSQVAAPSAQPGLATQPGEVATAKQHSGRPGPPEGAGRDQSEDRRGAPAGTVGTLAAGAAMAVAFGGWAVSQSRSRRPARQRA